MNAHVTTSRPPSQTSPTSSDPVPRHDAIRLTEGGTLAFIDLNGQTYSLRITRAGKLILTK